MINESKPIIGIPETYLNIGDGFNLLIGGLYKLIIGAASSGGMTNAAKVAIGETWSAVQSTWATEDDTWEGVSQLLTNPSKPVTSITNFAKP